MTTTTTTEKKNYNYFINNYIYPLISFANLVI